MTTLEKIRAEIDSHCSENRDRNDGLYIAMKIIDKYAEQEQKILKYGWTIIPKCNTCKYLKSPIVPCNRCKDNSQFEPQESEDKG